MAFGNVIGILFVVMFSDDEEEDGGCDEEVGSLV